jgi:uncharacterized protein (DUF58 family)
MVSKINLIRYFENKMQRKSSVYIVPTTFGFIYTGILFTIFLIGLTYTNNMTLIIAFWMLAVFLIQMLKTHREIKDFSLDSISLPPSHAKESQNFVINQQTEHQLSFEISYKKEYVKIARFYNLSARGIHNFSKIKVTSYGALSMFRSWRYIDTNLQVTIYPEKVAQGNVLDESIDHHEDKDEEFFEHLKYTPNLSAKRINWKIFAKTDTLYWKKFEGSEEDDECIDIDALAGDLETKLIKATALCYFYLKNSASWSLKYDNNESSKGSSKKHLVECLEFMAKI